MPKISVPRPPTSQQRSATNSIRGLVVAPERHRAVHHDRDRQQERRDQVEEEQRVVHRRGKLHERAEVLLEARVGHRGGVHARPPRPPPSDASPATAPSIAMRWSPRESIVPPRSGEPSPRTTKPSSVASMSAPRPRRPSTTPAIRSDSFRRSSSAPRTTVSPVGERAEQRHQRAARRSPAAPRRGSTTVPSSGPEATSSSPTGSSAASRARLLEVADDHGAHPLGDAEEAGAGPVEAHVLRPPPASRARAIAAATMNAADDGSPGTHDLVELELVHLRRPSAAGRRCSNGTRARRRRRSVWSRLGARLDHRGRARGQHARRSARTT